MTILRKHFHLLLALAFVLAMPLTMQSGSLASEVLIYGLAAMGCNLLLGHTGLLSFGQGIFFGLGSYTIALTLTRWPLPMPVALALAVVAGAVGAALVGWVAIRQRGTYFVMLTLAFAQMFYFLAYSMPSLTGGDNGLMDIPRPSLAVGGFTLWPLASPWQYYGFVAVVFLVAFWLLQQVSASVFGRTPAGRARQRGARGRHRLRPQAAEAPGVRDLGRRHRPGRRAARHDDRHRPLASAEYHTSEMILVMTVIGGTGTLLASLLGSAFYLIVGDWLSTLWPRWLLLLGVVLMVVSLGMQRGLWGLLESAWERLRGAKGPSDGAPAGTGDKA